MKLKRISNPKTVGDLMYNQFQSRFDVYVDQDHKPFAVERRTNRILRTLKSDMSIAIRNLHFEKGGGTLSCKDVNDAYATITAQMHLCNDVRIIAKQIHFDGKGIYCNLGKSVAHITKDGVTMLDKRQLDFFFKQDSGSHLQAIPDLNTSPDRLPKLLGNFFNLSSEQEILLYTYIITCFLPQINHPVLFLHGAQGSAKSTALRMLKRIIEPNGKDLFALPRKDEDLFSVLSNNYFVPFDNISRISKGFSDILCQAVTNGSVSKRKLYTDNSETVINLHSIVAISGVEMSITRSDLIDRSITIMLSRITENNRKTENEIWQRFHETLPYIMGAIFNALSGAIAMYPNVNLKQKFRMADFVVWGYCVAENIYKNGGELFLNTYSDNIKRSSASLIGANPLLFAVSTLMEAQNEWKGTPTELLMDVDKAYHENSLADKIPYGFPTNAIILSKQLALLQSDLKSIGITVEFGRGKNRYIMLEKETKQ